MADNTNQIIFPAEWGALRGRIAPTVQDSPSTYTIYARRKNGAYMDITGLTPTAKFTSTTAGGSVYTSTGTFTVTDGEAGEFTWLPSAADLGLDGAYYLQFEIDGERSEDRLRWVIQERLDSSGSVTPTAMAELTADELALVTALESALPAVEGDIFKYTGGAWTTTAESGGGGASDVTDLTTTTGLPAQRLRVAGAGGLEYRTTEQDLADLQDAGALATTDIGVTVQGYSAKTAAIAALTWAANSILLLTGTATASVQALGAHIVTFLQSANAAAALTSLGAAASSDLTTHTGLSTTAHGGILPEDAGIVAVSGARDLASTDAGKILECGGTFTLTCPNGLDAGFQVAIVNIGAGVITLAAATTLTTKDSAATLASQYGAATVYHAGSNVWRAFGDLS